MTATIRDVARDAGVSVATVSRVLNEDTVGYPVADRTRRKVLAAIEKLRYRPNQMARGLLQRRTGVIALVVPDISNPYYPELSRGLEDMAHEHGYRLMFCSTDRDPDKARTHIEALLAARVDGIVVAGGGDEVQLTPETADEYRTKVVYLGRRSARFSSVRVDNEGAAKTAVEHLIVLGHSRIGVVTGPKESATVRDRVQGYQAALAAHRLPADDALVQAGDFTEAGGYDAAKRLLSGPRPTAIFATNDRMAVGVLAAAADRGLEVPGDLALVGFDDVPMASYLRPALTTVSVSALQLGSEAMRLMLELLEGSTKRKRVLVKTSLVIRASCGATMAR